MDEAPKFRTVRGYQLMEQNKKLLTSAMEDYLEMIYRNSLSQGYLRINILSALLNVSAPSASSMVQKLSSIGLLDYKKHGIICLTESGTEIGKFLMQRHEIIELFLKNLGVKEDSLIETELIEHNISPATLHKLNIFNKFIKQNPDVLERFERFYQYNL
jgi:Mn-dependent DtxR family transcriptional regulator